MPGSSQPPSLSIVVTARNDDYGGRFLERFINFVDLLAYQSDRFGLRAELVVVEWNPPADEPRLIDALDWPSPNGNLRMRIIEVPVEVHHTVEGSDRMPMFEYIAKNTGIRRAESEFVLATNA